MLLQVLDIARLGGSSSTCGATKPWEVFLEFYLEPL